MRIGCAIAAILLGALAALRGEQMVVMVMAGVWAFTLTDWLQED